MEILRINARDTHLIRNQVLPGQLDPASDMDEDDNSFHLGAFEDKKLVSVASFYLENNPKINEEYQYRLAGVATLPEFQKNGLSATLLKTAFPIIKKNFCSVVWCKTPEKVEDFYKEVGFEEASDDETSNSKVLFKKID